MDFKVVSTDRFRKTFRGLKKNEQELVDNAINKWIENPQASSSNFEKLSFTGDNIFSIRANDAWRIIMAKFEGQYFLLHTGGQHDKTNDWAKGKRIDKNLYTGAIQIYSGKIEEFEDENIVQEPEVEYAGIFENFSHEQLLAIGVPSEWVETVQKITSEEQFMKLWDVLPDDAIENLGILLEGEIDVKVLIKQIEYKASQLPEKTEELIEVQPGLHVISEDDKLIEVLNKDINVFRFYLHPTQHYLAYNNFSGSKKVTGSAGTGKTVVALHRVKFLADQLKEGDKPILFTTFTKFLIKNIQALFAEQNIPASKLEVHNLDKLAFKLAKELEIIPRSVKPIDSKDAWSFFLRRNQEIKVKQRFLEKEYAEVILKYHVTKEEEYLGVPRVGRGAQLYDKDRRKIWKIFQQYEAYQKYSKRYTRSDVFFQLCRHLERWPEDRPFSHIVCDEVQDFGNLELRLLRVLVNEGPNDLFLAGDPFQNIYQKNTTFSKSGISIRGRSTRLKFNYRTTEEIRILATNMIAGLEVDDFSGEKATTLGDTSILSGEEPKYITCDTRSKELEYIKNYIKASFGSIGLHEICITARTKKEAMEIYEYLSDNRLPVKMLVNLENLSDLDNHVGVSTMHGVKGMEFKTMIITGFCKDHFPYKPYKFSTWSEAEQKAFIQSEYLLSYVAFSRATSYLLITGVGDKVMMLT
ncbi:3'-5' exonuclease [Zeaxanthinibacter enoshimensis]|uniref:DNA 3'-5' helicase n=1 Tax=Zeaxanthinibacter enoshimensis TaxID=392009 RepID=A0A4R6TTX0_9FLAO|nr:3'-5' exonuclease [Zeaxanthinibacter enoshimensis]TDQ33379.1 UvrD-like helicase family protein [Zeaxanthinibacter enoshimensis]